MGTHRIPFLFTLDIHGRTKHQKDLSEELSACLDELARAGIVATFFLPAVLIEECGVRVLRRLVAEGHQLACHGLLHRAPENFVDDPIETQIDYLRRAKNMIEAVSQAEVTAFRAPGFRLSAKTVVALEACGYRADLSINSQRLGLLSSQIGNVGWLTAPRVPYHPSADNPYRRGTLALWAIPTTAFVLPFTSNLYQALGVPFTRVFARAMLWEARHRKDKPIVYMGHPEEFYPSRFVRPGWKLSWRLFVPRRGIGFQARHLLAQRDEYQIYLATKRMTEFLATPAALEFLTVDQYVMGLERREASGRVARAGTTGATG